MFLLISVKRVIKKNNLFDLHLKLIDPPTKNSIDHDDVH